MTYADIIQYLTNLQVASNVLKATYVGDYDRIYDIINNPDEVDFPALWIESPSITIRGTEDAMYDVYDIAIVILDKGNPQNKDTNQYQIEQTYRMARRFLVRLQNDINEGNVRINLINSNLSPIDPYSADWLLGWRIDLKLEAYGGECYDAAQWDDTIEPTKILDFKVLRNNDNLAISNIHLLDSNTWTYDWKRSIDNGPLQAFDGELITDGALHHTYIVLTATNHLNRVRVATCFVRLTDATPMRSVPYLYSHYNQS